MKFEHEEKYTPTFRQWVKSGNYAGESTYKVERIFVNNDWRTITFVTEQFRINLKYQSVSAISKASSDLAKIVGKHCVCTAKVLSKEKATIEAIPASDADEQAQKYEQDDLGYVRIS